MSIGSKTAMNSRSGVNENNLVDFTPDLSVLNQLDSKDGILSFPFDHIYACHSASTDRRPALQLDREIEISALGIHDDPIPITSSTTEVEALTNKLTAADVQNKKLKDLLVYHLDLVQQQNELITKREKEFLVLKQENETLKAKINRRGNSNQRQSITPAPLINVPPPITVVKAEATAQLLRNTFTEVLLPDSQTNSFLYDGDINKNNNFSLDAFDLLKKSDTDISYLPSATSFLDTNIKVENNYTMIENKRSYSKKDMTTETRPEPLYTVTSNSGHPVIQRIQKNSRRSTGIGSMSRMAKKQPTATKTEATEKKPAEENKTIEHHSTFTLNKKNKTVNTYSKQKNSSLIAKKTFSAYTSLSERLQLIDKPPSGADPYQLGEADLREQSPIPKLMLAKSNNARLRRTQAATETATSNLLFDAKTDSTDNSLSKIDLEDVSCVSFPEFTQNDVNNLMISEPDLDLVKAESDIDWSIFSNKTGNETSLCDFSYGASTNNLASSIMPTLDFQELFAADSALNLDLNTIDYATEKPKPEKKKRGPRTNSLVAPLGEVKTSTVVRGTESKRGGRKRAFSATGLAKGIKRESAQKGAMPKPKSIKGKSICRGKKSQFPGMMSKKSYHTQVGDPDLSWYLGIDPDVKSEDVDRTGETKISSVEVPRWREKPQTSSYNLEGTENLDDKIFEKRHQKLEAEERRQLRWHMRRVREQRHVERLRQRQRASWCSGASYQPPAVYTIWPQPQRDVKFIEITDTLPVMAFGENLPSIPPKDFTLPWVRTSKAQKRSKRSRTTPH